MRSTSDKITPDKYSEVEFSQLVTDRFCKLLQEGKIMLSDQLMVIQELCSIMEPKTMNEYRTPELKYYSSVKYAIDHNNLMYFKIGSVIFIPKQ